MKCANCAKELRQGMTTGSCSLYQNPGYILCEPCFFDEDESINEHGNSGPYWDETLKRYERNQPGGAEGL